LAEQREEVKSQGVLALDLGTVIKKLLRILERVLARLISGSVVTLDISSTGVRIMETRGGVIRRWADTSFEFKEIERKGTESEETGTESEETGQTGLELEEAEPTVDRNENDLGVIVKQLMDSSGIKANKVNVSISGLYTISRLIPTESLPPGATLEVSVEEIALEIMPVPRETLYFFWQTLSANERDSHVFTVGVPKDIIDEKVRALKAAGINTQLIELKTMALVRAVGKKEALILNIEPTNFDIIVLAQGAPEIMHSLAWRPDSMSVEDAAEYLTTQLNMIVEHYNAGHVVEPFDMATPLYITGQMSVDPKLMEKLKGGLEFNIESLTPPLDCPEFLPISQYAANIGLAMRKEAAARVANGDGDAGALALNMNLLPHAYMPWRPTVRQIYSAAIIVAAVALIFPLLQLTNEEMKKTSAMSMKDVALNAQLLKKKAEIERREPLQKAIDEYHSIIVRDRNFDDDIRVIVQEAEKLGIEVSTLSHNGKDISVSCIAEDYISFRNYLTALAESGHFATPIPPPEGYPYTTSGNIKLTTQTSD
jgi:hypothetical protein